MSISKNPPIVEDTPNSAQRQNNDTISQANNLNSPIAPALFSDAAQSHVLIPSYPSTQLPRYDWENKWLKGDEYAFMLENIDRYCNAFDLRKFERKTHPENIYRSPQNGLIYFVEGNCVGSEFGFPRVPFRKQYRWKKMNFTTDLPKKRPQVTYIVASSVRCQKHGSNSNTGNQKSNASEAKDIFRMHAVILYKSPETKEIPEEKQPLSDNQSSEQHRKSQQSYILCHIRKIDTNEVEKSSLAVGGSSSNELSPEVDQDKLDQSEDEEDNDNEDEDSNHKSLQAQNKSLNVKRKSISQTTKPKMDKYEKMSKSQQKDHLKISLKLQDQLKSNILPETTILSTCQQQNNPVFTQATLNNTPVNNPCQGFRKLSECSGKNGCQAHESPTLQLQSGPTNLSNLPNKIGILTNRSQQILNPLNSSLKTHSDNHSRKGSSNSSSVSNQQQFQQESSLHQQQQQQQQPHQHQPQQQMMQNPFQNAFYPQNPQIDQISNMNCNNCNTNILPTPRNNSNVNNLPGLSCSSLVLSPPNPPISQIPQIPQVQISQQTQSPLSGLQLQLMLMLASQQQQVQQQQVQMQQQQQQQLQLQQQQQFLHLQQSIMNTPEKSLFNLLTLWQKNPSFGDLLYNILQRQLPGQEIDYYNLFSLSHSPHPPTSFLTSQAAGFLPDLQQTNCIDNNNNKVNSVASTLSGTLSKNSNTSSNNSNKNVPQ